MRNKKRNFSWVYQDLHTGDLVLVMKPHRKSIDGKYGVLSGVWKRHGARPETFLCCSNRWLTREEFKARYIYEGGLNTGIRKNKIEVGPGKFFDPRFG